MLTSTQVSPDDVNEQIIKALQRATQKYKLCPNRVWMIADSLPDNKTAILELFQDAEGEVESMFVGQKQGVLAERHSHDFCTADFCEQSQVDFTSITQRHESPHCQITACSVIKDRFLPGKLNRAANAGDPTAWHLSGRRTVSSSETYMAISHVWSDGTGAGVWKAGQVHRCLYNFFRSLARLMNCDGIWWDTICIPSDKAARAKAINNMHNNYADAKFTLLHDCFLRTLQWVDGETACLAILVSPWFSRGWTALELAKSHTVKVLFAETTDHSPTIKDLDRDILQIPVHPDRDHRTNRHKTAAGLIQALRNQKFTSVNQLLRTLRSRSTSWTRDMAVIAGLLVGTTASADYHNDPFGSSSANAVRDIYQQTIYQKVLKKLRVIGHGNLFHNRPTLYNNTSWCPANFFSLPLASMEKLTIDGQGNIVGTWRVARIQSSCEDDYLWDSVHSLSKIMIQAALQNDEKHRFLIEPDSEKILRAVLVRCLGVKNNYTGHKTYQFVGSLGFRSAQGLEVADSALETLIILNSSDSHIETSKVLAENSDVDVTDDPARAVASKGEQLDRGSFDLLLYHNSQKPVKDVVSFLLNKNGSLVQNEALCIAAREGCTSSFEELLNAGANPRYMDVYSRTVVSYAAELGHAGIIKCCEMWYEDWCNALHNSNAVTLREELLRQDTERTSGSVVELLCEVMTMMFDFAAGKEMILADDNEDLPAVTWAVRNGHEEIVEQLLSWYEVDVERLDSRRRTPLIMSAQTNNSHLIRWLIENGAEAAVPKDPLTPPVLVTAAEAGHLEAVEALLSAGDVDVNVRDFQKRSSLHVAAYQGHADVAKALLDAKDVDINIANDKKQTPLVFAARNDHLDVVKVFLKAKNVKIDIRDIKRRSPLCHAAKRGHTEIVKELLAAGAYLDLEDSNRQTPLSLAAQHGSVGVVETILESCRSLIEANLTDTGVWNFNLGSWIGDVDRPPVPERIYREIIQKVQMQGRTPFSLAAENGYVGVLKSLVACNKRMCVLFQVALDEEWSSLEDLKRLTEDLNQMYTSDIEDEMIRTRDMVNSEDHQGRTPLSWAAGAGHEDVVQFLLCEQAQIDSLDRSGRDSLWWASQAGHDAVFEILSRQRKA